MSKKIFLLFQKYLRYLKAVIFYKIFPLNSVNNMAQTHSRNQNLDTKQQKVIIKTIDSIL